MLTRLLSLVLTLLLALTPATATPVPVGTAGANLAGKAVFGCLSGAAQDIGCAAGTAAGVSEWALDYSGVYNGLQGAGWQDHHLASLTNLTTGLSGGIAAGTQDVVTVAASIGNSAFENNYLTSDDFAELKLLLEECDGESVCLLNTLEDFRHRSEGNQTALLNCPDADCVAEKLAEIEEARVAAAEFESQYGYLDPAISHLQSTSYDIGLIKLSGPDRTTPEQELAAELCVGLSEDACGQAMAAYRAEQAEKFLLVIGLIPVLGDAAGATECLVRPGPVTCGGALIGVVPGIGDAGKVLLRGAGGEVIAVSRQGDRIIDARPASRAEMESAQSPAATQPARADVPDTGLPPRFVTDSAGNTIDLNFTQGLTQRSPTDINFRAGRGSPKFDSYSTPNSYVNLGNGHALVYGPDGRVLYDVSGSRIKVVVWHTNRNTGQSFPNWGSDTKAFDGNVPPSVLSDLGLN